MIKAKKIKISEIAKDFDMKAKEIAELAIEAGMGKKSSGSSLTEDELNIIFDIIIARNPVEDFSMYTVKKPAENIFEDKKAEEPKTEKSEKSEKTAKQEKAAKADKVPETQKTTKKNQPEPAAEDENDGIIEVEVEKKVRYVDTRQNMVDESRLDDTKIEKIMQGTDIYGSDSSKQKIKKGPKSQKFDKQTNKIHKNDKRSFSRKNPTNPKISLHVLLLLLLWVMLTMVKHRFWTLSEIPM